MFNLKTTLPAFALVLACLLGAPEHSRAQGCGPSNPNCIVPTAPPGTSDNRAASTAFVQNAVGSATIPYANVTGLPANSVLGSLAGGNAAALTPTQLTTLCNVFATTLKGCVPSPGSVSGRYLGDDQSWHALPTQTIVAGTNISLSGTCAGTALNCTVTATGASGVATPAAYNAKCDVVQVVSASVSISSGAAALTVTGAAFAVSDVGKVISVPGAGPTVGGVATSLITTISAFTSSTQVTLANNASNTLAAAAKTVTYGSDDTTAFQTMFDATSAYSVDLSQVASTKGCMFASALTLSLPKHIYGNGPNNKLFFRQTGTAAGANFITMNAAAANAVLDTFAIDFDIGGRVSSLGTAIEFNSAATGITLRTLSIDGNLATAGYNSRCIDNLPNESKLINNYITGFNGYVIAAAFQASNVLVQGNRIVNGPKNSIASGVITFLSSTRTGPMGGLRIVENSIDTSNLAAADQTVGIYVYGGDLTRANSYNNVVIANNTIVGTAGSTTTTSAGILVTQAYNVSITGNSIKWYGEGIGTGSVVNLSVVGNSLYGNGTYSIESNGDTDVTISGNAAQSDGYSAFGITVENMINGVISNNAVDGTASAASYNGITAIGVNNSTGSSTFKVSITGNTVILPSSGTGKAITVQCNVGATACTSFVITGNVLDNASAIGAGSTGVFINHGAGTTMGNFLIGPNYYHLDTGVFIDTGVTGNCYVTGRNNSNTAFTNNGSASSCT